MSAPPVISETTKRVATAIYEGYDPKRNWYHTADLAIFALVKLGWGPQPAPAPQRTDAGGVADPLAPLPEDSYECRCVICYGGFLGHKHITVCPRCVRKNAEDAALIAPPVTATSPAVDEGMRDEIGDIIIASRFDPDVRARDIADEVFAAILASHEIMECGESPAPARVSADAFPPGTRVRRKDSEYTFHGTVVAAFTKLDGRSVRYVVEGAQEGNRGMLLIMSEKNLEPTPLLPIPPITTDDKDTP